MAGRARRGRRGDGDAGQRARRGIRSRARDDRRHHRRRGAAVVEIVAKGGWYGYEEKYNSNETRYPFLADSANPADRTLEPKLQKLALDAYGALGCRGVTRVDFRVSPLGRCCVLELNTSPGFTSHSLVPKAGMKTGLTFAEVCDRILRSAACDGFTTKQDAAAR